MPDSQGPGIGIHVAGLQRQGFAHSQPAAPQDRDQGAIADSGRCPIRAGADEGADFLFAEHLRRSLARLSCYGHFASPSALRSEAWIVTLLTRSATLSHP